MLLFLCSSSFSVCCKFSSVNQKKQQFSTKNRAFSLLSTQHRRYLSPTCIKSSKYTEEKGSIFKTLRVQSTQEHKSTMQKQQYTHKNINPPKKFIYEHLLLIHERGSSLRLLLIHERGSRGSHWRWFVNGGSRHCFLNGCYNSKFIIESY